MSDPEVPFLRPWDESHEAADRKLTLVAKGLLSAIPVVGGAAAELIGHAINQPNEERRRAWLKDLGARVNELRGDVAFLKDSAPDEAFLSFVPNTLAILHCKNISSVADEGTGRLSVMFIAPLKSEHIEVSDLSGAAQVKVVKASSCYVSLEYDERSLNGRPLKLNFRTVG
jgi:hypothetical protein